MILTPQGSRLIEDIAQRYHLSVDAVMTLLQSLIHGNGSMAQFSHPELGGSGQWMRGGMIMVGDMFNQGLKAMVDALCNELSDLLASQPLLAPPPQAPAWTPSGAGPGDVSLFVAGGSAGGWWPPELGVPASTGAQNQLRYAIFPEARRLVIDLNGSVTIYDTLDHRIGGVAQQQGADASFTFTSQYGLVRLAELPVVAAPGNQGGIPAGVAAPEATAPSTTLPPAGPTGEEADVFACLERLAALRQRGILTDEEFAAKKADLLDRI